MILIAVGAALYTQRVPISDWLLKRTQPALPEAIVYEEVREEAIVSGQKAEKEEEEKNNTITQELESVPEVAVDSAPALVPATVPVAFNLAVPFTSQAPYGDWSWPFKESCEEASLYMVNAFFTGIKDGVIDAEVAKAELEKIVAFEMELFGSYEDTTAEQTNTLAEQMYGIGGELIENPTVDQIKSEISVGHPVIVPLAGRLIGNPYYTAPGPLYHMLVIRGYTADGKFITNDPGTKHGQAYLYDFDTIMKAIHDWNGGKEITEGRKVVLVLSSNTYDGTEF